MSEREIEKLEIKELRELVEKQVLKEETDHNMTAQIEEQIEQLKAVQKKMQEEMQGREEQVTNYDSTAGLQEIEERIVKKMKKYIVEQSNKILATKEETNQASDRDLKQF